MKKLFTLSVCLLLCIGMAPKVTAQPACQAGFQYAIGNTTPNGTMVSLFDSSWAIGTITSWSWSFGNGTGSALQNPVTQLMPGTYNVCLTITAFFQNQLCTSTYCDSLVIPGNPLPCNPNFTFSTGGSGTQFNSASGTTNTSWFWDFGDSTTSTLANPLHLYSAPGTYNVCLTVTNSTGSCTSCQVVTIVGTGCNANFGYQTSPNGATVFNANTSGNVSWTWDFGDGSFGTGSTVTHNYAPGTYVACLTVATANGNTCTSCQTIVVQNTVGCSSNFALYPDTVIAHNYFLVNLATGAAPISYFWSWGDGTSSTGPYPSHTYASGGLYTICLTISDSTGCTSTTCYPFQLLRLMGGVPVTINVVSGTTSIQEPIGAVSFQVLPNPASDFVAINFNLVESANVEVALINISGQTVNSSDLMRYDAGSHLLPLNLSGVAKGIYVLELNVNGQKSFSKVVVQ